MSVSQERARFCDSCSAVIGWYATYCEECGMKVGARADETPKVQAFDPSPVQKDLFRAHMRVIHRHQEQLKELSKTYHRLKTRIERADQKPDQTASRDLVTMSDELVELEQDWEDIQRSYNRQSENIEEDFLERIAEMEADIEMAPDQQNAIEAEIRLFIEALEKMDEDLRSSGRHLDVLRARSKRGLLGLGGGRYNLAIATGFSLLLVGLGAALGVVGRWIQPLHALYVCAPAAMGVLLLAGLCRSRKI
ncbi:MAG TPA: hypothetical protein PKA37_12745 [Planctomycetota bacterium]|jgi:hypothetical protein|nr:hypothetical protein [Planctomycetota bacterium]